MTTTMGGPPRLPHRFWLDHDADPSEVSGARRFAGLTVTIDDESGDKDEDLSHELPCEVTVR